MGLRTGVERIDIRLNDYQTTAGLDDPTLCYQKFALGWGQQVDLHLAGQDLMVLGHDAQGRIACRAIANGKSQAGMTETVLLTAAGQDRGLDPGFAGLYRYKSRAQCDHHRLRGKAGMNPLLGLGGWFH